MELRVIVFWVLVAVTVALCGGKTGVFQISGTVQDPDTASDTDSLITYWTPPVNIADCIGGSANDSVKIDFLVNGTSATGDADFEVYAYLLPFSCNMRNGDTKDSSRCYKIQLDELATATASCIMTTDSTEALGHIRTAVATEMGSWLTFVVTQSGAPRKDAIGFIYWQCQVQGSNPGSK